MVLHDGWMTGVPPMILDIGPAAQRLSSCLCPGQTWCTRQDGWSMLEPRIGIPGILEMMLLKSSNRCNLM